MSATKFYSVQEFKQLVNLPAGEKAQVIKSPQTGKLFLAIGSHNFKCQASIDSSKEMKMLVEDNNYTEACLVNVTSSDANVLFAL